MMPLNQFLDVLKNTLPISKVIQEFLDITRKGHEFIAVCPFHNEKTPSFTINDQKGFYHCFGCGAHGDIITFLMEKTGLSFIEAAKQLSVKAGLEFPEEAKKESSEQYGSLLNALSDAKDWFCHHLWHDASPEVRSYIEKREVLKKTALAFHMGYAPFHKEALKQYLLGKGHSLKILESAGLINEKGYSRFIHRLIFPIFDYKNRVIGFGGRALQADQAPKYLNSPETPLFHKKNVLYGLSHAHQPQFDKKDDLIVVEGYMDVIALQQQGFRAVATMGTSLSEAHLQLLWKTSNCPILCFDGDEAGKRAALRAIENVLGLLDDTKQVKFCFLPGGLDPDDFIKTKGREEFQNFLSSASELVDVIWTYVIAVMPHYTPEQKAKIKGVIGKIQQKINNKVIAQFYRQDLLERFNKLITTPYSKSFVPFNKARTNQKPSILLPLRSPPVKEKLMEKALLLSLINNEKVLPSVMEELGMITFSDPIHTKLAHCLIEWVHESNSTDLRHYLQEKKAPPLLKEIEDTYVYGYAPFCHSSKDSEFVQKQWLELYQHHMNKDLRPKIYMK